MKRPGLAPHLLAATLFLAAARAADPAAPPNPQQLRARMLEMFDANKDGRLDETERAKAQRYAEELGFIPEGPLRRQLMQRFDRNGNGKIDDDERPAVREFLRQRFFPSLGAAGMAPAGTPPPAPPAPETADPAKVAVERVVRAAIEADPVQRKRFDRDGDGQISHAEWAMARREIQEALGDGLVLAALASEEEEKKMKAVVEEVAKRRWEQVNPSVSPDEQAQLDRVAKEVERQRKLRAEAKQTMESAKALPRPQRDSSPDERRRLEAVAAEVAARRRQQEKRGDGRPPASKSDEQTELESKAEAPSKQ